MVMRSMCLVAVMVLVSLGAVARAGHQQSEQDPWESFNRRMFSFNDALDRWALEPVAKGYNFITPDELQRCFRNFFWNLRVPLQGFNGLLQGKPVQSAS